MSIWTFKAAALAGALTLSGCVALDTLGGGSGQIDVTADAVTIAAPRGFCVDPAGTTDTGITAFVLYGNCQAIAGSRLAPQPETPAVLTAAVSETGVSDGISSSLGGLGEYFASEEGRATLSRSSDAETVEVVEAFAEGTVFYVNVLDTSEGVVPGVRDDYWRAYFDAGPRIVTLSVLALDGSALESGAQQAVLREFVGATRVANPPPGAQPGPVAPSQGFFGRLFGGPQG